jgi:hypothetical protein
VRAGTKAGQQVTRNWQKRSNGIDGPWKSFYTARVQPKVSMMTGRSRTSGDERVGESESTLNQQAWNYYQVHAEQRLIAANFYISIASVLAGALFAVLQSTQTARVGALLGVLLIVLSYVFWKWDRRTSDLIKIAEDALKYFEAHSDLQSTGEEPHVTRIFQREAYLTDRKRKKRSIFFWRNYYTYRTCLNLIFFSFASAGAIGAVLAFALPIP